MKKKTHILKLTASEKKALITALTALSFMSKAHPDIKHLTRIYNRLVK